MPFDNSEIGKTAMESQPLIRQVFQWNVYLACSADPGAGGGGILPIMACTRRLRPKGVPFSPFRYTKG